MLKSQTSKEQKKKPAKSKPGQVCVVET